LDNIAQRLAGPNKDAGYGGVAYIGIPLSNEESVSCPWGTEG
jgi:hypothetical protein